MGAVVGARALEGGQRRVVDVEAVVRVAAAEVRAQDLRGAWFDVLI